MTEAPRIAVIVPCFNDGELVAEAVSSVIEREPVELVVVDDASSDARTADVLDRLRREGIPVVRHARNLGLPAARMTGLRASSAPFVFPLDADDLAVEGALGAMSDLLAANPQVAVCFGDYREFGTHERVRRVPRRLDPYRVAYRNDYPVASLFRRTALEAVGGWQAVGDDVGYEDWNLWMALAEQGQIGVHWGRGVAFQRRLHGHRMLSDAGRRHVSLYRTLQALHPRLFEEVAWHRARSDLRLPVRWLYPVLFGARPPLSLRTRAEATFAALRMLVRPPAAG